MTAISNFARGAACGFLGIAAGLAAQLAATPANAADVVRIGAPLPLTGPLSPEGVKQQRGYNLWAEKVNGAGGVKVGDKSYKVELVYVDYESNTPRAVQTAERLITSDKVNFLFAPFGSGAAKAASSVSERYKVPTVAATASSMSVYHQGYRYLFGTFTPDTTLTTPITKIVARMAPEIKNVAIYARNDLFPLTIAKEMKKSVEAAGLKVASFDEYAIGAMDHGSALTVMNQKKPDWVFVTGYINDLILMRRQMGELGLKPKMLTMIAGPAYKEFVDATGPYADNVSSAAWWHPAVAYDGKDIFGSTANYVKAFQAKYGTVPDYAEASASAAGVIFQLAMEKAGSIDPEKVRDAIAALDVTTFYGPVRFGPSGQINSLEPPVFQIQGGVAKIVYPDAVKQSDLNVGGVR